MKTIKIDGSFGEGGGQILRSSLALSMITGQSLCLKNIRAKRSKPGLLRQHLTCVQAAKQISKAETQGDTLGSKELTFIPQTVEGGHYQFSIGSAGSALLVMQAVLPALMIAKEPSRLEIEGGTHNPWAPPYPAIEKSFLPLINRCGPQIVSHCERLGFYPQGGGKVRFDIQPHHDLKPLYLKKRGIIKHVHCEALVAHLPGKIAERETKVMLNTLHEYNPEVVITQSKHSLSAGNVVSIELNSENITEVFNGFGERNVRAEHLAKKAAQRARRYLSHDYPVGEFLADQLLIPMALAGKGLIRTQEPSMHSLTNIEVIKRFLGTQFSVEQEHEHSWVIEVL